MPFAVHVASLLAMCVKSCVCVCIHAPASRPETLLRAELANVRTSVPGQKVCHI